MCYFPDMSILKRHTWANEGKMNVQRRNKDDINPFMRILLSSHDAVWVIQVVLHTCFSDVRMDRWMDGWLDGWIDWWTDEWMNSRITFINNIF